MLSAYAGILGCAFVCMFILVLAVQAQRAAKRSGYVSMLHYGMETQLLQDSQLLRRYGFAQLLTRRGGGISSIGLSFGTMALIGSSAILFGPALQAGGFSVIGYGMPIIGFFYICVSSSVAEAASAFPTAGGLSHASYALGGRKWGQRSGWFLAIGHLAMLALMIGGCAYLADSLASSLWRYTATSFSFWCFALGIACSQAVVQHWGARWLSWLQAGGFWLQMIIAALVLGSLIALLWPGQYSPTLLYDMRTFDFNGAVKIDSFAIGVLLLLKLFLGMDGAAQQSEETIEPRVRVPWAIFLSTAYTFIVGMALLTFISITMIGTATGSSSLPGHASYGWATGLIGMDWFIESAMLGFGGSVLIAVMILVSLWGSGLHSMSVCSRALFSLGRDEAIPFSSYTGSVSIRWQAPLYAIWTSAVIALLLLLSAGLLRDGKAFVLLIAFVIVMLHIAYAIPIGLRLARGYAVDKRSVVHNSNGDFQMSWKDAPWQLGRWSRPVHVAAFIWLIATSLLAAILLDSSAAAAAAAVMLLITVMDVIGGSRAHQRHQ